MSELPWLTVLIAVPLVGAAVTALVGRGRGDAALPKQVALGVSLLTLLVGIGIALQYDNGAGMQLTETHEWISRSASTTRSASTASAC